MSNHVDDVIIIEIAQLLLSAEGQQTVTGYLRRRDKRAACILLWGAANSRFISKNPITDEMRSNLRMYVPLE